MKLIVTGGAGFIGSNMILHLHKNYPDVEIVNIDKLTYASDLSYLEPIKQSDRYRFKKLDIVDRDAVHDFFQKWNPDGIIHLAAESHVDNSIKGPEPFVYSNVVGTFNLLEESRLLWEKNEKTLNPRRFLHISTDEVYGTLGDEGSFNETTSYAPNSPYSASKASSDFLVRSYHHTFGMNTVITNCSNNYGPHQHDEKLIPTVIRKALAGEEIPVYGKGDNVRDWLFVDDHCNALATVFFKGKAGEQYNIGGDNEWMNLELVNHICQILNQEYGEGPDGDYRNLISFVTDRLGHDYRYAVNASKIKKELGWKPSQDFDNMLRQTVRWFMKKYGYLQS
ncbi:dTDP-glucose 4,6-dehydratase [Rhodohalobacter sp. 614A]|uniref:dTDP-glucose 4,6-dehydratase n=1 Tax=Rhodohalobacter sp. 614A TaxID=2908649 RepID=UPI001F388317|nr:dTDP-glucose 4,6-dehydratase [Rhodohalobacter sp. 614A]